MKTILALLSLLLFVPAGLAQPSLLGTDEKRAAPEPSTGSSCHVFVDETSIWTLEVIRESEVKAIPILNIITFVREDSELRPDQIHIQDHQGLRAEVEKFSIDTGVPGQPYITPFLKILGNSFIGLDLVGDFAGFTTPSQVLIDWSENRYQLQPIGCLEFEALVDKINKINFDSPDIREDFRVLDIQSQGIKQPRPSGLIKMND